MHIFFIKYNISSLTQECSRTLENARKRKGDAHELLQSHDEELYDKDLINLERERVYDSFE